MRTIRPKAHEQPVVHLVEFVVEPVVEEHGRGAGEDVHARARLPEVPPARRPLEEVVAATASAHARAPLEEPGEQEGRGQAMSIHPEPKWLDPKWKNRTSS